MAKPGFLFYFDWKYILRPLTDAERGALVMALMDYAETGQQAHFDDRALVMAWNALWPRLDEDERRYQAKVESRRTAANKRWEKEDRKVTKAPPDDGMDQYLNW